MYFSFFSRRSEKITDEELDALIEHLEGCKKKGLEDPWLLDNGVELDCLMVVKELREMRRRHPADKWL